MNKYSKGAFIFTGGVAVGAGVVGGLVLSSKDIRKLIAHKLADVLLGDVHERQFRDEDIIIGERDEADKILQDLRMILSEYGIIRLSDYKDLCGLVPYYEDRNVGWIHLKNAHVTRRSDGKGFTIVLPRLTNLK